MVIVEMDVDIHFPFIYYFTQFFVYLLIFGEGGKPENPVKTLVTCGRTTYVTTVDAGIGTEITDQR